MAVKNINPSFVENVAGALEKFKDSKAGLRVRIPTLFFFFRQRTMTASMSFAYLQGLKNGTNLNFAFKKNDFVPAINIRTKGIC